MNYSVPEFEADDGGDYSIPTSSRLSRKIKSPRAGEDEMMELVWENGQIVLHGQNQRSKPGSRFQAAEIRPEEELPAPHNDLFMEEDEMTDWLHYPLAHDLISDLDYPAPTVTETPASDVRQPAPSSAVETGGSYRPPVHPTSRPEAPPRFQNFALFSRYRGRAEPGQGSSNDSGREFTVAESNETPAPEWRPQGGDGAAASAEKERCQVASSGVGAEPMQKPPVEDRKRKGREADVSNCHSEPDVDFDSLDAKRQGCGPVKKSRAAEVHNLSERKRRDRINEKMKALQELIPHSNKTDKASMLDEAIEYLKSLQLQVQMMSMGYSMVPMMFPGVQQQYMTPVAMGMGMDMPGMARPMVPYSSLLSGSALPSPAHLGPRFTSPAYHIPPFPFPDPSGLQQQTTASDPNLNLPQIQGFPDAYQQYLGFQQTQMPYPQNQAGSSTLVQNESAMQPSRSNNHENLQSGC